jgi:hypothetical protein
MLVSRHPYPRCVPRYCIGSFAFFALFIEGSTSSSPRDCCFGGFLALMGTFLVMIIQSLAGVFNLGSSSDHLPVEDVYQIAGICI